jgi:hypothetical protein
MMVGRRAKVEARILTGRDEAEKQYERAVIKAALPGTRSAVLTGPGGDNYGGQGIPSSQVATQHSSHRTVPIYGLGVQVHCTHGMPIHLSSRTCTLSTVFALRHTAHTRGRQLRLSLVRLHPNYCLILISKRFNLHQSL